MSSRYTFIYYSSYLYRANNRWRCSGQISVNITNILWMTMFVRSVQSSATNVLTKISKFSAQLVLQGITTIIGVEIVY